MGTSQCITFKVCSKCKIEKLLSEFHRQSTSKDDFQSACKQCDRQRNIIYRKKNKETVRAKDRERAKRKRTSLTMEEIRKDQQKYYQKNRDSILAKQREYANKNRKKINRLARERYKRKGGEETERENGITIRNVRRGSGVLLLDTSRFQYYLRCWKSKVGCVPTVKQAARVWSGISTISIRLRKMVLIRSKMCRYYVGRAT